MKRIIFCNSLSSTKKFFRRNKNNPAYIVIDYNNSFCIKDFLDQDKKYQQVDLNKFLKWKEEYLGRFIDFVGKINIQNNKRYFWWGLNFTNKNPISTGLCNKIYYALLITEIIEDPNISDLLVISKDRDILRQVKIFFSNSNIRIINLITFDVSKESIKNVLGKYTPIAVFYAAVRALARKIQVSSVAFDRSKNYTVVLSLLNHQSFKRDGSYEDTYFGKLLPHIVKNEGSLINLLFVNSPEYRIMMRNIDRIKPGFILLPLEYFLSIFDILKCFFISLGRYFLGIHLAASYSIDGKNVTYLVKAAIKRDFSTTYFYDNIRVYYEVRNFIKKISIAKFYYPFENRSIEKLILLVIRKFCLRSRIIGYQHPALSLRHTNFLLTPEELEITPLPDKIITFGEITKEFMVKNGNFPVSLLQEGCALRQQQYFGSLKKKKKVENVLVILATNIEEYIKVLRFMDNAFRGSSPYSVWIRPHPVFSLDEAIAIYGKVRFCFHKSDQETLSECLDWADIVLYVHSTVAIESLARGIPVVYLNIDNVINPDPLFSFNDFRWKADSPQELTKIIREINSLSEEDFYHRQKRAVSYTERYFYPVNEKNLNVFLKA